MSEGSVSVRHTPRILGHYLHSGRRKYRDVQSSHVDGLGLDVFWALHTELARQKSPFLSTLTDNSGPCRVDGGHVSVPSDQHHFKQSFPEYRRIRTPFVTDPNPFSTLHPSLSGHVSDRPPVTTVLDYLSTPSPHQLPTDLLHAHLPQLCHQGIKGTYPVTPSTPTDLLRTYQPQLYHRGTKVLK